ncbi:MAG: hypothetical protein HYY17_04240 [Planctomycetes bacterium]|nr:hypothetical protein [Planctomycetota bacterium]
MPRNERQFVVYLLDGSGKHGKILEGSFAAYGDAVLAPDAMIDVLNADGRVSARVMVVAMPEVSADGPAPEAVRILVGTDGYFLTSVPVPPRQSVLMPMKAPAVRGEVHIACYESSKLVPERLVTAWGTGRTGATVRSREVLPETADETVKLDLSSLSAERFPAVAWFYHRRAYIWKEGTTINASDPRLPEGNHGKPGKVISNSGRVSHVSPILFVGTEPKKDESLLDSPVVGGMTSALMNDALGREAGTAFQALTTLSGIAGQNGAARTSSSSSESSASSVTNIYITIPPHTGVTDPIGALTGGQAAGTNGGLYRRGGPAMGQWSYNDVFGGNRLFGDPAGTGSSQAPVTYDPATGTLTGSAPTSGYWVNQGLGFDPFSGPTFGPRFIFTNRKNK